MKQVIICCYELQQCSQEQYDQIWDNLRSSGWERPQGLIFHVGGCKPTGNWQITDVWSSMQDCQSFNNLLTPILKKLKITQTELCIMPAHYMLQHVEQEMREEIYS